MEICRLFVLIAIFFTNKSDCQFTAMPGTISSCENANVTLTWSIKDYTSVSTVQWKKHGATIMSQVGSGAPTIRAGVTNIEHGGDGAIVIKGVQSLDTGEYSCHITYSPGSSNMAASSTATLILIRVAPINLPPRLESVVEKNSINHTCVLDTKGTPEVDVTIKIGSDEKSSATHSVPSESEEDISCCVSGDAVTCLTESSVTKQCWKLKGSETSTTQQHSTSSTIPTTVITTSVTTNTTDSFPSTRDFVLLGVGESIKEAVLNTGQIIGGAVGSVIVLAIGIVVTVLMFKRRNWKLRSKERSPNGNNQMSQEGPYTSMQNSVGNGSEYLEINRGQERSTNTNNQISQEGPYTSMQSSTGNENEYLEINREQGQQQTGDTKMYVNLQLNVQ